MRNYTVYSFTLSLGYQRKYKNTKLLLLAKEPLLIAASSKV
jgi:hypothetical protein